MPNQTQNKKFWEVKAENTTDGSSVGHLYLYGPISTTSWYGDEVTPKQLREDLKALGDITELDVHIFSDGGDVFAGTAIYSILKQQKATINVYIEGIAASIATVIAMAGDQIYISHSGMMYIHNAMVCLWGYYNAGEMAAMIKELEKIREPIIAAYQLKTGKTREEIIAIMDGEDKDGSWLSASEAIEAGFSTAYIPEESDTALDCAARLAPNVYRWKGVTLDYSQYANAPKLPIKTTKARRKPTMPTVQKKAPKNTKLPKTGPKNGPKAELIEITCPECGETFQYEVSQDEEATLIEVTCPECGATFDWDSAQEEEIDSATNELFEVTCPECGATFDWEVEQGEADGASNRRVNRKGKTIVNQIFTVTCPECGASFEWEVEQGEGDGDGTSNRRVDKYAAGAAAERKRMTSLDGIAAAYPEAAKVIAKAKREGWSYNKTSRQVFAMMTRKRSDAAAQDQAAGSNFLAGFAKDLAGGKNVGAAPNGGNNDDGKGTDAAQITAVVDYYNQTKTNTKGGKK